MKKFVTELLKNKHNGYTFIKNGKWPIITHNTTSVPYLSNTLPKTIKMAESMDFLGFPQYPQGIIMRLVSY